MATRQVIDISKIVKCHVVESGDDAGTFVYEAETAYDAGTMVAYNGALYCSIVDIEATDTDTPLDAPDKWAFILVSA